MFTIAEAAKIYGGEITPIHSHNCASRRTRDPNDCACNPPYRVRRFQRIKTNRRAR